jgi:hypothetical protein
VILDYTHFMIRGTRWTPGLVFVLAIKLGTFNATTEADWTVNFELKPKGVVLINTHGSEIGTASGKPRTLKGKWKQTGNAIEIKYGKFHDRLALQRRCSDWKKYPCFKYEKTLTGSREKSPLNVNYPYINWAWKN